MYGKRPEGKKLMHVKLIDGTEKDIKTVAMILGRIPEMKEYQPLVTNDKIELVSITKLIEKLQGMIDNGKSS